MYNAASKLTAIAFMALALVSCGNNTKDEAMQLSAAAEHEVTSGNYDAAMTLLDTLDTRYASEVEVRRSAMKFRAMAVEGLTMRRISTVDDTLALLKQNIEKYESKFEYVANPGKGLGGNLVDKSIVKLNSVMMPRINDEGYFTLSIKINGRSIGFSHVVFYGSGESVSTGDVAPSRLVKVEGSEMTVMQQEDVSSAMEWLVAHPSTAGYELVGAKSTIKNKMSEVLREAMVQTWLFAQDKQAYRLALIEREKLERKLQLCRDQLANVIDR